MKTRLKKSLSVFLSIVMLLSITAGIDLSAYAKTTGNYEYKVLKNNTVEITNYNGSASNLTIPSKIKGRSVTRIGESAFSCCISLKSITVPNGITSIGSGAFSWCNNLSSVTIPKSITNIAEGVFFDCVSLTSITIPNSVTSIGQSAFSGSGLTSITIPNSITSIGDCAFNNCTRLTNLTIPKTVKTIGNNAFYLVNNVNYNGSATGSPWGAKSVNGYVEGYLVYKDSKKKELLSCSAAATKITIPNGVTSIGDDSFLCCVNLTSIIIPNSITIIGEYAFASFGSLTDVYYRGSKEQWNKISIGDYNYDLENATMHYHTTHNENKVVKKNIKRATLTSAGSYYSAVCCSICDREISRTKKTIPKIKSVKLGKTSYVYDGNVKKPVVTVMDAKGNTLKNGTDYTVSYAKGRKNVGKYSVKITFKGLYKGTKTLYFTIKPKATSISKLTAGSKKFTVKWYKRSTQVTGYQVQYSRNKSFKNAKTKTVSKNSTTSKTISKLLAKKKYYVRVRTYKIVKGTKYYSAWSGYKYVTTKA